MRSKTIKTLALLATLLIGLASTKSSALTCGRGSAGTHLNGLFAEGFVPVVVSGFVTDIQWGDGSIDTNPPDLLDLSHGDSDDPIATATLEVVGMIIETDGNTSYGLLRFTMTEHCVLDWCGSIPDFGDARLFVLAEHDGSLKGAVGPCGGGAYPLPTGAQIEAIRQCLANGRCDNTTALDDFSAIR